MDRFFVFSGRMEGGLVGVWFLEVDDVGCVWFRRLAPWVVGECNGVSCCIVVAAVRRKDLVLVGVQLGYADRVFVCFCVVVGEEHFVQVIWGEFGDELGGFVVGVVGEVGGDGGEFGGLHLDG